MNTSSDTLQNDLEELKRKAFTALCLAREDALKLAEAHHTSLVTCTEAELRTCEISYYKEYFARIDSEKMQNAKHE